LIAEVLEHVIVELLDIVDGNFSRDTVAADDVLPEEFLDGCGAYVYDGFCINPLCKVLNYYDSEGVVALSWS
jgi:hypothetical protein